MVKNNLPIVSVIIPVYNSKKTIIKCIESLLDQDYPNNEYEIIVIDNNSKDRINEIIKNYPVKYVKEDNIQSSYAARNKGIKNAKGNIFAFIDADCVADKKWLKIGIQGFESENIGCVAGEIKGYKPENYVEKYLTDKKELSQEKTLNNPVLPYSKTANTFYKKEVFEKIGLFEEKWVSAGDADFAWRMQLETDFKIKFVSEAVVYHKHRSTIKSMFGQCVKWGIGNTLLYKKYKGKIPQRTLKQKLWILQRLFYIVCQSIVFAFLNKNKIPKEKRDRYLDLISFAGWEIGRIIGSVKNRVFYV
jgi:cellulose synthase/poly-beta-1,6-N-acetylglucosamine synthase-like glycosyltransferase